MRLTSRHPARVALACAILFAATPLTAQTLVATPYDKSGIYAIGKTVGWTIALGEGQQALPGEYTYVVKQNGGPTIRTDSFDLSKGPVKIETSLTVPGMIRVEIRPPAGVRQFGNINTGGPGVVALGAAVDPANIKPAHPRPADFDAFWEAKIKLLEKTPMGAVETAKESGVPDIDFATVRLNNIGGAHVYGQLAKPHREGKFPALMIYQWAGVYPLQKAWVVDRAKEGWLAFNIESHDLPGDMPQEFWAALPAMIRNYNSLNNTDRERNYFLQMYLGDYRAVEYLASRPDWDGRILVATGTSMGGQQSFAAAGLNAKITAVVVNVPAGSDANGPQHERAAGYPNWDLSNPLVAATSPYFDVTNFASRIKVPTMAAFGFIDAVVPPVGVWSTFNLIQAPKEAVPMIDSPHNHQATPQQLMPWTTRSAAWLAALRDGGKVPPP